MLVILLDGFAGDLPAWVQVAFGLATLIISITSMYQSRRIQELTDITIALSKQTEELRKQTEIQQKRYELESDIALYKQVPNFQFNKLSHHGSSRFTRQNDEIIETSTEPVQKVELINFGATAHGVKLRSKDGAGLQYSYMNIAIIKHGESFFVDIAPYDRPDATIRESEHFRFILSYKDDLGRSLTQEVNVAAHGHSHDIKPPKLVAND